MYVIVEWNDSRRNVLPVEDVVIPTKDKLSRGLVCSAFWGLGGRRKLFDCKVVALSKSKEKLEESIDHWWQKNFQGTYHRG